MTGTPPHKIQHMEEEKRLYPFLFEPIGDAQENAVVQLADLGYHDSVIRNGRLAADTIGDVMETYMERVVGDDVLEYYGRQFPICVRTIVSDGHTPLLVCPDDETAEQRFDFLGKAKLWYVVSAEPGAMLYMGFGRDVEAAEFYESCLNGSVEGLLHGVKPERGDCFLIKPGTVHCLAGRMQVCEIAESSPLDFRLYGWGVPDPDGESGLNLEAAFDFIDYRGYDATGREAAEDPGPARVLADTPQFVVTERRLAEPIRVSAGSSDSFATYSCVSGEAYVYVEGDVLPDTHEKAAGVTPPAAESHDNAGTLSDAGCTVRQGETVLIPADVRRFHVIPRQEGTVLLEATVPPRPQADGYTASEGAPLS